MPKQINIDYALFEKKAKKLAKQLGKNEPIFVKQQTGLLARDAAKFTPPFATYPNSKGTSIGTRADKLMGEWAIRNDIAQIVTRKSDEDIQEAVRIWGVRRIEYGGGFLIALGIINSVSKLRGWHNSQQNARNRTRPLQGRERYWCSESVFEAYVKMEQQKVGIAKASFSNAAVSLGAKGSVPKWIRANHGRAIGMGIIAPDGKGTKGVITAAAGGLFHTGRAVPKIMRDRLIKAVKRAEYVARKSVKDSNFKLV